MPPKGKSSRGRGGGATTRQVAAGGGATTRQPLPEHDANHQVIPEQQNKDLGEEEDDEVGNEDDQENPNPNEDYQEMLDRLLPLPGRQHLPLLSTHPIPGVETLWY
ncbi:unnamed protein product [Arabidopsis lyrata]|nr:unnamed protein product [Arabidopsis lyrata]